MDAHTPHPALSSPQKEFRSTPRPSISLQRKCSNYWHIQYMVGLPGWGVNIKPTDNHVGYNKPDTVWQDLAGHAMVEGARICGKCVRLLPHTKGFNEDERVQFWTQQRTKGGKGEARGRGRKRAQSPPITNDVPCPPSSSPHPCTPSPAVHPLSEARSGSSSGKRGRPRKSFDTLKDPSHITRPLAHQLEQLLEVSFFSLTLHVYLCDVFYVFGYSRQGFGGGDGGLLHHFGYTRSNMLCTTFVSRLNGYITCCVHSSDLSGCPTFGNLGCSRSPYLVCGVGY